jgi:hypothetical protein
MENRVEFSHLEKELLALIGLMSCLKVAPSQDLEKEFRRISNVVTKRLPQARKESIEAYRDTERNSDDTIRTNIVNAETK